MLLSDNPASDIAVIAVDLNEWAVYLGVPVFLQISSINCEKFVTFTGSQLYQFLYNCGFGQLIAVFTHWLKRDLAFGSDFDRKYVIAFIGQLSVQVSDMRLSWVSSVLAFIPPWWFFCWVSGVMMRYTLSFSSFSNFRDETINWWWNSHPRLAKCMAKMYRILNLKATGLLILRYSLILMISASGIIGWCFVGLD